VAIYSVVFGKSTLLYTEQWDQIILYAWSKNSDDFCTISSYVSIYLYTVSQIYLSSRTRQGYFCQCLISKIWLFNNDSSSIKWRLSVEN
jgi:hypothetical protein